MRKLLPVLCLLLLFGTQIYFFTLFLTAYNNPSKTVVMGINRYGEGFPELVLNIFSTFIGIPILFYYGIIKK